MKSLIIFLMFLTIIFNASILYADRVDEEFVTVSFNLSDTPTHWTNDGASLNSQTSQSSSSSSEQWGNTYYTGSTSTQTAAQDTNHNGQIDVMEDRTERLNYRQDGTRTTDTTTKTTTKTAVAVSIEFTLWDIVDPQGAFSQTETEFNDKSAWTKKWDKSTSGASGTNSTRFQVRKDTEDKVKEGVKELNRLYNKLFPVEERIEALISGIQAYRSNPEQDKEHTDMMSELAKLRKEEYDLKTDIRKTRAETLDEKGTGPLGWTIQTDVQTDTRTTTSDISQTSFTESVHNGCFVDSTIVDGLTVFQVWSEKKTLSVGKLVRSGHFTGPVYMFYDATGRALLPGSITPNHQILTTDLLKMKSASDIQKGDRLICGSNEIVTVDRIEVTQYQGYIYNLANDYALYTFHPDFILTAGIHPVVGDRVDKHYTY